MLMRTCCFTFACRSHCKAQPRGEPQRIMRKDALVCNSMIVGERRSLDDLVYTSAAAMRVDADYGMDDLLAAADT
jgi:hypothetical protein